MEESDADKEPATGVMAQVTQENGKMVSDTVKAFLSQKNKPLTMECGLMISDTAQANCFTLIVATESKAIGKMIG